MQIKKKNTFGDIIFQNENNLSILLVNSFNLIKVVGIIEQLCSKGNRIKIFEFFFYVLFRKSYESNVIVQIYNLQSRKKIFGTEWGNLVKLGRKRRVWGLLLRVF